MPADEPGDERSGPPLSDLADHVRSLPDDEVAEDGTDGRGPGESFREESFDEVEPESLWAEIDAEPAVDVHAGAEGSAGAAPREHVVSKRLYCESCEYFAEAPAVHCGHPGTSILEFVDLDHVRVRNCPIVAARRAIDEEDEVRASPGTFGRE